MVATHRDYQTRLGNLKFKAPIANKKGYPTVNFTVDDENIRFQLTRYDEPHTKAPFGISVYIEKGATQEKIEEKERETRKNFDVTIKNQDSIKFFQAVEESVIQAAIANKATWFKKGETLSDTQIRSMFTSSLVIDDKYDPRLRTKVNCDLTSKNVVQIVEMSEVDGKKTTRQLEPLDIMKKPVECIVIVEVSSLWFQAKSFGMSYVSTNILVFPDNGPKGFAFDLGEETPMISSSSSVSSQPNQNESTNNPSILFSQAEEDQEEEEEEENNEQKAKKAKVN